MLNARLLLCACRPSFPKLNVFLFQSSPAPGSMFRFKKGCSHCHFGVCCCPCHALSLFLKPRLLI